ncbi:endocuticle structural glycoprotein SgAbd-8-like [Lutzomyia longipalpis]|uniref:endocuticle structural glycoprotein SgAbd-8-like n=1 Tax=Lutzomyia longipalpis TaxID=7200 RepID=UPI00248372AC|nr:endocuticle structural glycoprotein SgAbd-8-like [Lutzomyia longipalpis]
MKLFIVIASVIAATSAAHLGNSYIPPPSNALSAGGSPAFLQGPRPSNQYLPPGGTNFRHSAGFGGAGFGGPSAFAGAAASQPQFRAQPQAQFNNHGQYQPQQYNAGPQIPILRYNNNVNAGDGQYEFDYATGNGIMHQEQGHVNNLGTEQSEQVVSGSYSYTGDDGKTYSVSYRADSNGFQPVGDHLPTPPPIPEAIQKSLAISAARSPQQSYDSGAYRPNQHQGFPQASGTQQQYLPPSVQSARQSFNPQTGYHY